MQLLTSCSRLQATQHSKETPQDCKQEEKNLTVNRVDDRHALSAAEEQLNGRNKEQKRLKIKLLSPHLRWKQKNYPSYEKAMSYLALNPFELKK